MCDAVLALIAPLFATLETCSRSPVTLSPIETCMNHDHSKLPLSALRVLAVEQYGAGPFGTPYLADLGAEVVKIENHRDGGDVGRHVGVIARRSSAPLGVEHDVGHDVGHAA